MPRSQERNWFFEHFVQLKVLMKKNFWLSIAQYRSTLIQIISPLLFMILLFGLQKLYNYQQEKIDVLPAVSTIGDIPKCLPWNNNPCHTLLYAPQIPLTSSPTADENEMDQIIIEMASRNNPPLRIGGPADLNDTTSDVIPMPSEASIRDYILSNPNATAGAIIFRLEANSVIGYTLLYNTTIPQDEETGARQLPVHISSMYLRALDQAIFRVKSGGMNVSLASSSAGYPIADPRFVSNSIVSNGGAFWFYCPPMFTFMILVNQIVTEKENKLRMGMRIMGLKNSMFWLSWFFTAAVIQTFSILLMYISGLIFQFDFFNNTNFVVIFFTFFLFSMSMVPLAFLISTFTNSTKTANNTAFVIFIIGLLLQIIFTTFAIYFWYSSMVSGVYRKIFMFYPPFNFAKCFADIAGLASPVFSIDEGRFVRGPGYHWTDLYKTQFVSTFSVTAPPTVKSYYFLLMNGAIFMALAWYFDNLLSSDTGTTRPPWFILNPSFWGFNLRAFFNFLQRVSLRLPHFLQSSLRRVLAQPSREEILAACENDDVRAEAERTLAAGNSSCRVIGLSKRYSSGLFSSGGLLAVDTLTFSIDEGQVLCLLGHNGAGKTTTINVLTGLIPPSSGDAFIYDLSVATEQDKIRRVLGVCPQHDILWPELTAAQHLEIFAQFKAVPSETVDALIQEKLKEVELSHVANQKVHTFSGGMKRRLSVAISSIGDPLMIFFDEPTTGLDPVSRRRVWQLIENLKKGRVVLLTTHSMEEADLLSDRIAIMAGGKLKCIGTALHLKNSYGDGYRLNLVTDPERTDELQSIVVRLLPGASLVTSSAGSSTFMVPLSQVAQIPQLFAFLSTKEGKALVKDWGLSHTSLEEVFHNVTTRTYKFANSDPIPSPKN